LPPGNSVDIFRGHTGRGAQSNRGSPMSFLAEFWRFLRTRKKYWLAPILIVMVMFGGLVVLSQGSAVAPFIYTLF
jgi:hypothetical protein